MPVETFRWRPYFRTQQFASTNSGPKNDRQCMKSMNGTQLIRREHSKPGWLLLRLSSSPSLFVWHGTHCICKYAVVPHALSIYTHWDKKILTRVMYVWIWLNCDWRWKEKFHFLIPIARARYKRTFFGIKWAFSQLWRNFPSFCVFSIALIIAFARIFWANESGKREETFRSYLFMASSMFLFLDIRISDETKYQQTDKEYLLEATFVCNFHCFYRNRAPFTLHTDSVV